MAEQPTLQELKQQREELKKLADDARLYGTSVKRNIQDRYERVQEIMEQVEEIESRIATLTESQGNLTKQITAQVKARLSANQKLSGQSSLQSTLSKEVNDLAISAFKTVQEQVNVQGELTEEGESQLDTIKSIVSGTNDIAGIQELITGSEEKAKKLRGESEESAQNAITSLLQKEKQRLQGVELQKGQLEAADQLTGGLASKAKGFADMIKTNPKLAALGAATATVAILAKLAGDFAEMIGSVGKQFGSLKNLGEDFKNTLFDATVQVTKLGGSIGDVIGITNALSSEFGITLDRAAEMSPKVFDISKAIGLSVDETSKLLGTFMQLGGLTLDQAENLTESTYQLARQAGVNPQAVLKDIAGSTEAFAMFSKDGGKNFAEAAIQARAFGTSIDATAKAMRGVLNFQESITKEVDASVLLGTQLNLQRARELALDKDAVGFQNEIKKQLKDIGDFQELNVFQQEALSEALGYSLVDMNKMLDTTKALSLEGALASKSFEDLLGVEGISQIESLSNEFKSLAVNLVKVVGPFLEATAKFLNWVLGGPGRNEVNLQSTTSTAQTAAAASAGVTKRELVDGFTEAFLKIPPSKTTITRDDINIVNNPYGGSGKLALTG